MIFCFCGVTLLVVTAGPRKSTSFTSKWPLVMLSLLPAFQRHLKTARRLLIICSGVLAAMPRTSTYCAHLSALIARSRFLRMKLENADKERLSPCSNLRYANVVLAEGKCKKFD